nr:transporter substrate-binding domain-containing protein [uncultured Roseateles sp.]
MNAALVSLALLATLVLGGAGAEAQGLPVQVYADTFPPLQYPHYPQGPQGKAEAAGYVQQFVWEVLGKVDKELPLRVTPLQFVPLKRALQTARQEPNALVLSVARTPEREADFIWLSEVSPYRLWLYRASGTVLPPLHTVADLKGRGLRFGVQSGANFHEWLRAQGIGQPPDNSVIEPVTQNQRNFRMALANRIDLFAHPELSLEYRLRENQLNPQDFVPVMPVEELSLPLWLVISRGSDAGLVRALQRQLELMKVAGRLEALRRQYLLAFRAAAVPPGPASEPAR